MVSAFYCIPVCELVLGICRTTGDWVYSVVEFWLSAQPIALGTSWESVVGTAS